MQTLFAPNVIPNKHAVQTLFTPNFIPNKHAEKLNRMRNNQGKSYVVFSVFSFSLEYTIKEIYFFFSVNTKYISSHAVKISAFSLMLHTLEKY